MSEMASNAEKHSGMFWPVGQEDRAWSGQLQLARFGSGKIAMASVLEGNSAPEWLNESHVIIHGITLGRERWTLEDCSEGDATVTVAAIHFKSITIWFRRAWRGAYLTHAQLHRLESVELHFEGLHPYIESDSLTSRLEQGKRILEIPEPTVYTCTVAEGELSLTGKYQQVRLGGVFSLIPRTILRYQPKETGSWPNIYSEIMHHANTFLSFLVQADFNPSYTWATADLGVEGSKNRFELLHGATTHTALEFSQEYRAKTNIQQTSLPRSTLLQNWMKARNKISYSFYNYWLTITDGPIDVHRRFLFSIAAVEGIDRAMRGKLKKPEDYLKSRLSHLLRKSKACSLWRQEPDDAADNINKARNSVMHGSEQIGTKPDSATALWMTQLCQAVYEQNLWEVLGVPDALAAEIAYTNARSRLAIFVPELPNPVDQVDLP